MWDTECFFFFFSFFHIVRQQNKRASFEALLLRMDFIADRS